LLATVQHTQDAWEKKKGGGGTCLNVHPVSSRTSHSTIIHNLSSLELTKLYARQCHQTQNNDSHVAITIFSLLNP
jgi:hypothetical protein